MNFFERLTPTQRRILLFGVPLVALAAIVSMNRRPADDDTDAPAGDPDGTGAPPRVGVGPGGIITGNPGAAVDTGVLSSFLSALTDKQQAGIDQLRADNDIWRADLEQTLAARDQERDVPTTAGPAPLPNDRYAAIVTQAYIDVLGRRPDPAGLAYWSDQLRAGMTQSRLRTELEASAESRKLRTGA